MLSHDETCLVRFQHFNNSPSRLWFSQFVDNDTFIDTYRYLHPDQREAYTCWETLTGARVNNYGVRIDYIVCDGLASKGHLIECQHRTEVESSDHCPVVAQFDFVFSDRSQGKPPMICTKFWSEFKGTQMKLSQFVVKTKRTHDEVGSDRSFLTIVCSLVGRGHRRANSGVTEYFAKQTSNEESQVRPVITVATFQTKYSTTERASRRIACQGNRDDCFVHREHNCDVNVGSHLPSTHSSTALRRSQRTMRHSASQGRRVRQLGSLFLRLFASQRCVGQSSSTL